MKPGCFGMMTILIVLSSAFMAMANPPFQLPGQSGNLDRLPDDQVEGTIWEYRATRDKQSTDGSPNKIDGKFRIEDSAIFEAGATISLPKIGSPKEAFEMLRSGEAIDLKLPEVPQAKRIGEYRKLSRGRYQFDFNNSKELAGKMVVWKKKNTNDVWMGYYNQIENRKIVAKWTVELRAIQD